MHLLLPQRPPAPHHSPDLGVVVMVVAAAAATAVAAVVVMAAGGSAVVAWVVAGWEGAAQVMVARLSQPLVLVPAVSPAMAPASGRLVPQE